MKKARTIVKMFMPRFAPLVRDGRKTQTIRPTPKKIMPRIGDRFSGREWKGRPYASKKRKLRDGEITDVRKIFIGHNRMQIEGGPILSKRRRATFAKQDGFNGWLSMIEWFEDTHGLPFEGILIQWKPDP